MPAAYPTDFKVNVIRRYEKGESIKLLSEELHIAQSTLYQWRKDYCSVETPNRTYTPKEFDAVCRRLRKLEHEIEIIRLSGHLENIPLQKRLSSLEAIYTQRVGQYNVHELCEALGVARGTFYNHIFRRADRSRHKEEQEHLMLQVQQVFDDSGQRYGAKKIQTVLVKNGIRISKERVAAIMQELGLHSIRVDAKKLHKQKQQYAKENLLKRIFSADHPNQVWVSDITYFKINAYWVYLCIILDLYSRRIIGWRVSRHMSTHLITSTFKKAYQERCKPQGLTFHSDRGSQYTSKTFSELLRHYGVKQSFSATARPTDNAVAETFFATFKKEEAYRKDYTSERHFRRSVEEYIRFYNEIRPHQTLGYKTPQEVEDSFQNGVIKNRCSNNSPA